MKYELKVQNEFLKGLYNEESKKTRCIWKWGESDGLKWVTNGCFAKGIWNDRFFVQCPERLKIDISRCIAPREDLQPAYDTGMTRDYNGKTLRIFELENREKVYIDSVFLKYFEIDTYEIVGENPKAPIQLYHKQFQICMGIICPVNVRQ